ncbi:MAG: hypothetical protein QF380_08365, partial [Candidatus Marinimicrobia bacterium]|nr:hypothetical protein [Candidatus Neomarinimicrobiota bacterium]
MGLRRKTILLLIFSSFMSVGWGQDCPENMFWSDCGSMCEPTCSNPEFDPDITCPDVCVEGCFCNSGFIFLYDNYWDQNYNICIPIEDCQEEPPCDEETEVELWGECYNIEETTELDLRDSGLTGEIPSEIGQLTNLTYLNLYQN